MHLRGTFDDDWDAVWEFLNNFPAFLQPLLCSKIHTQQAAEAAEAVEADKQEHGRQMHKLKRNWREKWLEIEIKNKEK